MKRRILTVAGAVLVGVVAVIVCSWPPNHLHAKSKSKKRYYEFLKHEGNTWRYKVLRVGPKSTERRVYEEEHEVLTHKRWGWLNFVQVGVHVYVDGKAVPNQRYTMSYLTYQNLLYATRGRRKFTKTEGLGWMRDHPPLMRWVLGFKDWSHRKFPKEKYRAGGVREMTLPVGDFKFVKTFTQTVKGGAIVRKYWVDHRAGILKVVTTAKTGEGVLTVTKTLARYQVK